MVDEIVDPRRPDPGRVLPEREMLEQWLEYQRATLLLKCEGLDDGARKRRPIATSKLSLHGIVRHMAEVERGWFEAVLARSEPDLPGIWIDPDIEDSEFVPLDDADWDADLATWQQECESSRAVAASKQLDDTGQREQPYSLRWIYVHMIEEYARHNGHADLIREMVDGSVGC